MAEKKYIGFHKFFLVCFFLQCAVALSRDFVLSQRYPNMGAWVSEIVPASFGLVFAAVFNAVIAYGVYRAWKFVTRPKTKSGDTILKSPGK